MIVVLPPGRKGTIQRIGSLDSWPARAPRTTTPESARPNHTIPKSTALPAMSAPPRFPTARA